MRGRTFEDRAAASALGATFEPRPKTITAVRPASSYGIKLVLCPMGPARIPRASCERRFLLANEVPGRALTAPGHHDADVRASRCNGCPVGAKRCGVKLRQKPRRHLALVLPDVRCACGVLFEPESADQKRCPTCIERDRFPSGYVAKRRVWGRDTRESKARRG